MEKPAFIFATCRAGSETALKREVASRHGPLLTPAFMRPQLITWKALSNLPPAFELNAAFAAVSGRSLGSARSAAEVAQRVAEAGLGFSEIHVFPRITFEDGVSHETWQLMDEIKAVVEKACPCHAGSAQVLDIIVGEVGEPWFIGTHRRSLAAHPHPGAMPRLILPPEAPSRAWLKMEQSLAWLGLDAPDAISSKTALELGSAPGGASWALLQRGAKVIGVDTGLMEERVTNHPHYDHISMPAGDVPWDYLPERVDLFASDMNLAPDVALRYIEPLCRRLDPHWLILTLKMNHPGIEAQIPRLIQAVEHFAPGPVYARQLHANRREITVVSINSAPPSPAYGP